MARTPLPHSVRRLVGAVAVSSVGDGMALVAFPLLAIVYTRQPSLVAGVAVASRLPAIFIALPAGAFVDRVDRRKFMIVVETIRFAVLLAASALIATGHGSLMIVYVSAIALGIFGPPFDTASAAVVPELVDGTMLARANSRITGVNVAGNEMVGQATGGALFAAGRAIPFLCDALSFLFSAALIRAAIPPNESSPASAGSFWTSVRDGLRLYRRHRVLRLITALVAMLAFFQSAVVAILVLFATVDLHLSSTGFGVMLSVSAVGTVLGSLVADRAYERFGGGAALVVGGVLAALAYPALAVTSSPIAASAAITLEAFGVIVGNVACQTLRQTVVPAGLQGRARSVYLLVIRTAAPAGAVAGGLLATAIGIRSMFLVAGLIQLAVVGVVGPRLVLAVRSRRVISLTTAALSEPAVDALAVGPKVPLN